MKWSRSPQFRDIAVGGPGNSTVRARGRVPRMRGRSPTTHVLYRIAFHVVVVDGFGATTHAEATPQRGGPHAAGPIGNRTSAPSGWGRRPTLHEGRPERRRRWPPSCPLDARPIIDTDDDYSLSVQEHGHRRAAVAEALATYGGPTDDVLVATQGWHRRPGDGMLRPCTAISPREGGLWRPRSRLRGGRLGLYRITGTDPRSWAESVGAWPTSWTRARS